MTQSEFKKRYIQARRDLIERDFSGLNPSQREAVLATEGPSLLLAGAGSGKTTVLINRIANLLRYGCGSDSVELPDGVSHADLELLENPERNIEKAGKLAALDPVEPWRIIAITFTNKAADELKARLEQMLGPEANDIWAMTFHSACVRILRRDADRFGFDSGFTIYDTSDSQSVMKRIIKQCDLDDKQFPFRAVLSYISRRKDALVSPETDLENARNSGDFRKTKMAELYGEYARCLREASALDFDDLIYYAVRLLLENEDVRGYYQRKFRYVLIDEYQDTNNLQYILASTLAGGYENICVVGDDDQSIYKFRGATIENILNFEEQYKGARVIRLEQNYRSTGHILDAANAVIRNNVGRKGKKLWTDKESGDQVIHYTAQNEHDEAYYVADQIIMGKKDGGAFRDNAVLYRMNAQSNQLEYAFKRNSIPYRIYGGTRFFDRAEVKDMLAYLCVIASPRDDLRLMRIINVPTRGIGQTSVENAAEIAAERGESLFEIISHADEYPAIARAAMRMRQFAAMLDELRDFSKTLPVDELYEIVLERTGYIQALEAKQTGENSSRVENVRELLSNIKGYIAASGDSSLSGFLDEVALYTDLDKLDRDADCVVMMTMHAAKGLEFPNVFIIGTEEGIFPGVRSIGNPDDMEEERRLCYVAMTRAQRRLHICCARQRMLFGKTTANRVSRFVEEIPAEHICRMGAAPLSSFTAAPKSPPPVKQRGFAPPAGAQAPAFKLGDRVTHGAFGGGVIKKMTPMGGDQLVEIDFGEAGTKRLMLRAAARYLTKSEGN